MTTTKHTQVANIVLDIKNLETDRRTEANLMIRTKNRIIAAIRFNEGLENVMLHQFMIRRTDSDVHLAYFKSDKEVEKVARDHANKLEVIKPKRLQREDQTQRIRSCTWINRNSEYTQLTMNSDNITATIVKHRTGIMLIASVYIPCIGNGQEADKQELHSRMQEIQMAMTRESDPNPDPEIFIAGDFNRHDSVWERNEVALGTRQGEGSRILDLIEEDDLQLLTERGAPTWERSKEGVVGEDHHPGCVSKDMYAVLCKTCLNKVWGVVRALSWW
jgi:hypothetical protein